MERNEALTTLGLPPTATPTAIKDAHLTLTSSVVRETPGDDPRARGEAAGRLRRIEEAYRSLLAERRRYADQVHERETIPRQLGGAARARRKGPEPAALPPNLEVTGAGGRFPLGRVLLAALSLGALGFYLLKGRGPETRAAPSDSALAAVSDSSRVAPPTAPPAVPPAPVAAPPAHPPTSAPSGASGAAPPVTPVSLAGLSQGERMAATAACAAVAGGDQGYNACLAGQLEELRAAPQRPDLSRLTASQRDSLTAACANVREHGGLAAYRRCLVDQVAQFTPVAPVVDLTTLTEAERAAVDSTCQDARNTGGEAGFNRCAAERLAALRGQ